MNGPALADAYRRKFGSEIGTDNAREIVSPEYAASRENRTRFSHATQKPAGMLSEYLFEEALRNPDRGKPRVVVFTAGGTGAGKTSGLTASRELSDAQFIYDSNLGSKKSSVEKIDAAKAAGNRVRIYFVYRDPVADQRGASQSNGKWPHRGIGGSRADISGFSGELSISDPEVFRRPECTVHRNRQQPLRRRAPVHAA